MTLKQLKHIVRGRKLNNAELTINGEPIKLEIKVDQDNRVSINIQPTEREYMVDEQ